MVEPYLMVQIFEHTQTSIVKKAGLRKKKLAVPVDKQTITYNFVFFTLENTNSFRNKIISNNSTKVFVGLKKLMLIVFSNLLG